MPLATMTSVLREAQKGRYAVPAFNVCTNEHIDCVFDVSLKLRTPVIIAIHPVEIAFFGMKEITRVIQSRAETHPYPVVMHLDHGDSYDTAVQCMVHGFTSVMFDGSTLPLEENIAHTREIVKAARAAGVSVEAELGLVGGTEGDAYAHTDGFSDDQLTDPETAVEFIKQTGADSLAVAIGTAHGFYQGEPRIDVDRLMEIRKRVEVPLVLHGGSGISDTMIQTVIQEGICKINISSEFKRAYHQGLTDAMEGHPDVWDPIILYPEAKQHAKQLLKEKFELFGSVNQA